MNFKILKYEGNNNSLPWTIDANTYADMIYKDSTTVFIFNRGYCLEGLFLTFHKGKVSPEYHFWDDGGNTCTVLKDFESYDLQLNATSYKWGDTIKGIFKGTVINTKEICSGKDNKLVLEGEFIHIIEDTKHKMERLYEAAAKRKFIKTGFYFLENSASAQKYNIPKYKLINSNNEYCLSYNCFNDYSSFKNVQNVSTANSNVLSVKFIIKDTKIEEWKKAGSSQFAFVIDNELIYVGKLSKIKDNALFIDINTKDEAQKTTVYKKIVDNLKIIKTK